MSRVMECMSRTTAGMEQFFVSDKMVVLLLAVLIFFWLQEEKQPDEKGNRLLVFSLVVSILLLFPLTAVLAVIYQTPFYDYGWLWSMVPTIVVISYAVVLMYDRYSRKARTKTMVAMVAFFMLLLFGCGNQGVLQTVEAKEAGNRTKAQGVIAVLEKDSEELVLWAPRSIMQETRRQTGEIKLVYGRDMWEAKAGAYDYEGYSPAVTDAYLWMEDVEEISEDTIPKVVKILWEMENMNARSEDALATMLECGVNAIVMPVNVAELFEETFLRIAKEQGKTVEEFVIEDYTLYRLK